MNTSSFAILLTSCTLAVATSACSQGPVTIGDQQSVQKKSGLAAYTAEWQGYIQAHTFSDGADNVSISINEAGTGTLKLGDKALLSTPTDPNAKFPPDFPACQYCGVVSALPDVRDDFLFTLKDVRVETERLRADATNKEVYQAWCKLQTSHPLAATSSFTSVEQYSCSACVSYTGDDGGIVSDYCMKPNYCSDYVDLAPPSATSAITFGPSLCEREMLCEGSGGTVVADVDKTCFCDSNGCDIDPTPNITLDVALSDDQQTMTGTLALPKAAGTVQTNYTVVLKRQ